MRKIFFLAIILTTTCVTSLAQPRAIGGRLGFGFGVSYQHGFKEKNMLQVDLDAIAYNPYSHFADRRVLIWGVQTVATYNWIFPFKSWKGTGSWNWYTGVGGGIGVVSEGWDYEVNLGVAGMIGVEYNFKFPLQLSFDLRPVVGPCYLVYDKYFFVSIAGILINSATIGIRYKF
jgi:hypothetical protein